MFGSKLAAKLWETTTERGIGNLCKPWQIRREGVANLENERNKMLVLAQTEKDVEDVKNGNAIVSLKDIRNPKLISLKGGLEYEGFGSMEPYIDIDSLSKIVSTQLVAGEIQKEINVSKSLLIAEDILAADQSEPTKENVEADWLTRWRDSAATSSSEQLQDLWGRILAGEIKSPGSYSLRTIEFIKNLTQKEASKIQKIFSYVFFDRIIKGAAFGNGITNQQLKDELNFTFLSEMQSLGIISGVESIGLTSTFTSLKDNKFYYYHLYNKKVMEIEHDDQKKELKLSVILLTPLGNELRSLCPETIDGVYLDYVIATIKSQGFKITIGDIDVKEDGLIYSINKVEV